VSELPNATSEQSATISVIRRFSLLGFAAGYLVHIDDKFVGDASVKRAIAFLVLPGTHNVQIWNSLNPGSSDILQIHVNAGETCWLECKPNAPLMTNMFVGTPRDRRQARKEARGDDQLMPPSSILLQRINQPK
jgi:hypothetical protein